MGRAFSTRLKGVSRMRVAIASSPSKGALTMEKLRRLPLPSVSGGSISETFTDWPALKSKPGGLTKRKAIVPSATSSRPVSSESNRAIDLSCARSSAVAPIRRSDPSTRSGGHGYGFVRLDHPVKIETLKQRRLHHLEVRRDVEIARRVKAVVPDVEDLPVAVVAARIVGLFHGDLRQDRVAHRLKGQRDQRRADGPGRIAASEGDHAPPPAHRNGRRRKEIAREIEHVLHVVPVADTGDRGGDHFLEILGRESDRAADARVHLLVVAQGNRAHAFLDIGLDQNFGLGARGLRESLVADEERRVRPGRLRQVLDRDADARVALDQQHVAGAQRRGEKLVAVRRDLRALAYRLRKISGNALAKLRE